VNPPQRRGLARVLGSAGALFVLVAASVVAIDSLPKSFRTLETARSVGPIATLSTVSRIALLVAGVVVPLLLTAAIVLNREGNALGRIALLSGVLAFVAGLVGPMMAGPSVQGDYGGVPSAGLFTGGIGAFLVLAFLLGGLGLAYAGRHYLRHAPSL